MQINYLNFNNSIIEKLGKTVKSQALIIVGWLGAPERKLIQDIRQHIMVVDHSRKLNNFLKPGVKAMSAHSSMLERFNFSRTRKIFYISAAELPFVPLNKLINIFLELKFRPEDINLVFLLKDHTETIEENRKERDNNRNHYKEADILDSHLYSTVQLYNYLNNIKEGEIYQRYDYNAGNADLIIASNKSVEGLSQTNGSPRHPAGVEFHIIPLKRPGSSFPDKKVTNKVTKTTKGLTPATKSNPFMRVMP